jgi:hypothetical protein
MLLLLLLLLLLFVAPLKQSLSCATLHALLLIVFQNARSKAARHVSTAIINIAAQLLVVVLG